MATAQVLVNGLLLDAVKNNTVEVVDDLIRKHAADPHQVPPVSAGTLIHKAAYHSDHKQGLQIAQSLVEEHRVDALREDTYYQTPVFAAARVGNTELCGFLLKHGSSVDTADPHRQTPLFYAARHDHFATVDFLVEKGAHLEQKDDQGFTPIFWAAVSGRAAMMKHLSQKGARVDALSTHGRDVLHSATGPAVRAAIELGCDPELQDAQGRTRLFQDVPRGKFEKAKVLIEYGANIDKQDIYGQTCLFHAANQCNKEAVQFLLQLGANPLISDKKKRTCRGYMESRCLMDAKLQAPVLKLLKAAEKKRQALEKKRERELQQAQRLLERHTQETPRGRKRKAANTVDEKRNRSPPSNSKDARRPFRLVLVEHGEEVEPASQHYQKRLKKLLEEPELGRILKGAAAAA